MVGRGPDPSPAWAPDIRKNRGRKRGLLEFIARGSNWPEPLCCPVQFRCSWSVRGDQKYPRVPEEPRDLDGAGDRGDEPVEFNGTADRTAACRRRPVQAAPDGNRVR